MSSSLFSKAKKSQAKARVAFSGPSGSGKTYWSLQMATELADGGKIAVIDTERSSASLYADKFAFDTLSFSPPYNPQRLVEVLRVAEQEEYAVVVIDSLTHFWSGKGGTLEIVEEANARLNNSYRAWAVGTPIQQQMIDALLSFNGHIVVTMRSKTEWAMDKNEKGKTEIRKVGLAPQQRDGIEYEFTLVFDIDAQHRASVSKTRCVALADRTFTPANSQEALDTFTTWLNAGEPLLDSNKRNAVENRIANLNPETKSALKKAWSEANLPKVAQLTETRYQEVIDLLTYIEGGDGEAEEVIPS